MNRYTIDCTEEQTRKALELGAPLNTWGFAREPVIPNAEQMIGWLRSKSFYFHFDDETNYWRVSTIEEPLSIAYGMSGNKELAAIDAALEHLIKNKK